VLPSLCLSYQRRHRGLNGIRVTRPITMAFATNTLVNGEWTTRTIDVDAVLRHYDQQDREASVNAVQVQRPPVLGLLTQTALRSPLVHWILRGRLRDLDKNDVAFIGVGELLLYLARSSSSSCASKFVFVCWPLGGNYSSYFFRALFLPYTRDISSLEQTSHSLSLSSATFDDLGD
jgi:hypothetical protein